MKISSFFKKTVPRASRGAAVCTTILPVGLFRLANARGTLIRQNQMCAKLRTLPARRSLRELLPDLESHSLDAVAAHFGHKFHHHDALEDAIACATIIGKLGIPENFIRRFDYCSAAI